MRNQEKSSKRTSTVVALTLGILMMTLATPVHAISQSIAVIGTSVSGGDVNVTVKNFTLLPQTRTIQVTATVNGQPATATVGVVLLPFQTSTVRAGLVGVSTSLGIVCIVDEGTPF